MKTCIACKNGKTNHNGWCSEKQTMGKVEVIRELNGVILAFRLPSHATYADQVLRELEHSAGHSKDQYGILSL